MNKNEIKVLIVDDSAFMRKVIQNAIQQDQEINVLGYAKDGIEALKKAKELNPDIITLDVEMPNMDGLACLEALQKQGSYAIIMLSSLTGEKTNATIRALELGAFDFISKPNSIFDMSSDTKKDEIIEKIKLAYRTKKKGEAFIPIKKKEPMQSIVPNVASGELKYIIAIGISTGGPRALTAIIPELPADLPAAVVIVQHMPPGFTKSLAIRLNEISQLTVKEAEDSDELKAGHAYVAPGDNHLTFKSDGRKTIIKLTKNPPVGGFRPSVDVMMTSLAESDASHIIGVIMTGMGSDGSKGLKMLKDKKKPYIIAQDESTSIVFGMPRSAIEIGVVDKTVPLQEIPASIINFMGVHR